MQRKKVELKDGWRFALCDTVPDEQAYGPVTLPHDWIVTRTVTPDAPLTESQGFFVRGDVGWYALDLELPELEGAQEAVLHFGGVWENSTVFVNERACGEKPHPGARGQHRCPCGPVVFGRRHLSARIPDPP